MCSGLSGAAIWGWGGGGSTVGVSTFIADGLHLGDVFGRLEVHGVSIFVVIFFSSSSSDSGSDLESDSSSLHTRLVGEGEQKAVVIEGTRVWEGCWSEWALRVLCGLLPAFEGVFRWRKASIDP